MNQFTYNKAIAGAAQPVQSFKDDGENEAPYMSAIERQMESIEKHIAFLHSAIDTLEQRLRSVTRDNPPPCKTMEESLPHADSPLGKGLEQFNSRLNATSERILHIIESLEV